MSKFSVTILFLVFFSTSFSQKKNSELYLKRSFNLNGFQYEFTVLDEDKRGVSHYDQAKFYFWFKSQRVLSTQGASSGQLLNGKFQVFYNSKQLFEKGIFHRGLKHGKWQYWRSDGTLLRTERWKNGTLRGKTLLYDTHGKLTETRKYFKHSLRRTTADSTVCERLDGSKRTVWLKDSTGKVVEKHVFKNGFSVAAKSKATKKVPSNSSAKGSNTEVKNDAKTTDATTKDEKASNSPSRLKRLFKRKSKQKATKEPAGESIQTDPQPTQSTTETPSTAKKGKWWRKLFSKKENGKQQNDKQSTGKQ